MKSELVIDFEIDPNGMTVPYPPLFDDVRRNHGFQDIRGRPDIAAEIPEAGLSPALRELLVPLASEEAPLFSLGCDIGTKLEAGPDEKARHLAGGYIQIVAARYSNRDPSEYYDFAQAIADFIALSSKPRRWYLRFVYMTACVNLDGNSEVEPSLWIWFESLDHSEQEAVASREDLISALRLAIFGPETLVALNVGPR